MKYDAIYRQLKEGLEKNDYALLGDLLEKLSAQVRSEKTTITNKTRLNAIKRVASKFKDRPALTGFGIYGDYKVITDSYHLVMVKEDVMPLQLVATEDDLKVWNIDKQAYFDKYGYDSILPYHYPNVARIMEGYNTDNQIEYDYNDIVAFYKENKGKKDALYKLGEQTFNPLFLKNVIEVLGTDAKAYYQGENKPLYFVNDKKEQGIVLPIKVY